MFDSCSSRLPTPSNLRNRFGHTIPRTNGTHYVCNPEFATNLEILELRGLRSRIRPYYLHSNPRKCSHTRMVLRHWVIELAQRNILVRHPYPSCPSRFNKGLTVRKALPIPRMRLVVSFPPLEYSESEDSGPHSVTPDSRLGCRYVPFDYRRIFDGSIGVLPISRSVLARSSQGGQVNERRRTATSCLSSHASIADDLVLAAFG